MNETLAKECSNADIYIFKSYNVSHQANREEEFGER
jgi:hypothetical protein